MKKQSIFKQWWLYLIGTIAFPLIGLIFGSIVNKFNICIGGKYHYMIWTSVCTWNLGIVLILFGLGLVSLILMIIFIIKAIVRKLK